MGHPLIQPFRHATSLGKPTRNPSYLPSSVFSPDVARPADAPEDRWNQRLADIEEGIRALEDSPKLQQSLASVLKSASGEIDEFIRGLRCGSTAKWNGSLARTSAGPSDG